MNYSYIPIPTSLVELSMNNSLATERELFSLELCFLSILQSLSLSKLLHKHISKSPIQWRFYIEWIIQLLLNEPVLKNCFVLDEIYIFSVKLKACTVHAYANFGWFSENCQFWLLLLLNFIVIIIAIQRKKKKKSEEKAKCSLI